MEDTKIVSTVVQKNAGFLLKYAHQKFQEGKIIVMEAIKTKHKVFRIRRRKNEM